MSSESNPAAAPAAFRVYNKGSRLFTHFELNFPAGRSTPVPEGRAESVRKMIADYPDELFEAGTDAGADKANRDEIGTLRIRVAELTEQNVKLHRLVAASDDDGQLALLQESVAAGNAAIAKLQEENNASAKRIAELESLLDARNETIRTLQATPAAPSPAVEAHAETSEKAHAKPHAPHKPHAPKAAPKAKADDGV